MSAAGKPLKSQENPVCFYNYVLLLGYRKNF